MTCRLIRPWYFGSKKCAAPSIIHRSVHVVPFVWLHKYYFLQRLLNVHLLDLVAECYLVWESFLLAIWLPFALRFDFFSKAIQSFFLVFVHSTKIGPLHCLTILTISIIFRLLQISLFWLICCSLFSMFCFKCGYTRRIYVAISLWSELLAKSSIIRHLDWILLYQIDSIRSPNYTGLDKCLSACHHMILSALAQLIAAPTIFNSFWWWWIVFERFKVTVFVILFLQHIAFTIWSILR